MIRVQVKLFGAFRKFAVPGDSVQAVTLELLGPTSVQDLREHLALKLASLGTGFDDRCLVAESAFANEESVLDEQTLINGDTVLAILPPVCGG
jgi:molybdopterin converting factor small subunit